MNAGELSLTPSKSMHPECTFGGVWNGGGGGGGEGQKNLYVASFFYERAAQAGFIDPNEPVAIAHPRNFQDAAKQACETTLENAKASYPRVIDADLPYLCMDLVYQYTLLSDGFGRLLDQIKLHIVTLFCRGNCSALILVVLH